MSQSNLSQRLAMRIAWREWIEAAYVTLLGREPEAEILADQGHYLRKTGDIRQMLASVAYSDEHWLYLLKKRADQIVQVVFQALLGRQAEPEAIENYTQRLMQTDGLYDLVGAVADSKEHFARRLAGRLALSPDQIVQAIFRALLGRQAEPEAVENYTQRLVQTDGLHDLVGAVADSDEYFARRLAGRLALSPDQIVQTVFRALLGRQAEPEAIENYTQRLVQADGLYNFISIVGHSNEHLQHCIPEGYVAIGNIGMPGAMACDTETIVQSYIRFVGNIPTKKDVADCLKNTAPLGAVLHARFGSPIKKGTQRILIFGAYGNGNLGDVYQGIAVRELLRTIWQLPLDSIFSCSFESTSNYPFFASQKLNRETILNISKLNEFDCLVIGGGGLFGGGHGHTPLIWPQWVRLLHVPILILGVGGSSFIVNKCTDLLERSWFVSGRDEEIMNSFKVIRPDAIVLRDPLLCAPSIEMLQSLDELVPDLSNTVDVLWILKYPYIDDDKIFLEWIVHYIAEHPKERHVVLGIEPALDQVLRLWFPNTEIIFTLSLSVLTAWLRVSTKVVTMRYHGAIFAAKTGKYFCGFSQYKIRALINERVVAGCYVNSCQELEEFLENSQLPVGGVLNAAANMEAYSAALSPFRTYM